MKNSSVISVSFLMACLVACSTAGKKAQETNLASAKTDVYSNIQKIAEVLPLKQKDAIDFFTNLDSLKSKSFHSAPSQQFQYKSYTVFYAQPGKGKIVKGIGIDLDSASHVNMDRLGRQLNVKWHSADLIEMKAGRIHYSTEYIDSKKRKKYIHIAIALSYQKDEPENKITFIGIDSDSGEEKLKNTFLK